MKPSTYIKIIALFSFTSLSACSVLWKDYAEQRRQGNSSSLVEYLYPEGRIPPGMAKRIPHITVPIRLGIAFVPGGTRNRLSISSARKQLLLRRVKDSFSKRPIIQDIKIIPDHYLMRKGGFSDLNRVAALFGVDQIALISYDQIGSTRENPLALTYWTIVGAFIVPGNSHEVRTLVDMGVFDVRSRKLILRAAGQHRVRRISTLVNRRERYRRTSVLGFTNATDDMIKTLDIELASFKDRIRRGSKEVKISYRRGYSGSYDSLMLLFTLSIVGLLVLRRKPGTHENITRV